MAKAEAPDVRTLKLERDPAILVWHLLIQVWQPKGSADLRLHAHLCRTLKRDCMEGEDLKIVGGTWKIAKPDALKEMKKQLHKAVDDGKIPGRLSEPAEALLDLLDA